MGPEEEKQRGLTRERLVEAALALVNDDGLEGLSMRALADRLEVKAASLYWHVRDRRELLELLADSILEPVRLTHRGGGWRASVQAAGSALGRRVSAQKDADRILLEVPEALRRSRVLRDTAGQLSSAGLQQSEAEDVALMLLTYVVAAAQAQIDDPAVVPSRSSAPASIAIDSGSRGVALRAGPANMQALIRVPPDQAGAAPAVIRGEHVVVRRLRGVGRGEIELNPLRPWNVKVQAPTWNTRLDLGGLDVRMIHVDSGAANIECFLPAPSGVVPVRISSGVVNVTLHRATGAAVVATAHTGAVRLKLEDFSTRVAVQDVHWNSDGALGASDRYELDVAGGVVNFKLDTYEATVGKVGAQPAEAKPKGKAVSALDVLLDGVEARIKARS